MNIKRAKEIACWVYEEPYSIYSFDGNDHAIDELMDGTYYYALNDCNALIGYICLGRSACVPAGFAAGVYQRNDVIDFGLGMRPDLCGKGQGISFLKAGLDYTKNLIDNNKLRLTVASFNKRAISVYEKMGFLKQDSFKKQSVVNNIEFQTMVTDNGKWIEDLIINYVNSSEHNKAFWDKPLVGFSRGNDSYYSFFKDDIGGFYLTPAEFMNCENQSLNISGEFITVVSWVLPQTEKTRTENALQKSYPSESWVRTRIYGDDFNKELAQYIVDEIKIRGIAATSPMISNLFEYNRSDKYGYASNWSERHAAFVSGLGTFGLCDGLITKAGKAMRCGSVIIGTAIKPTVRSYLKHNEYCLYFSKGICMECARRCPAGAISKKGHNKNKCREYQRNVIGPITKKKYGIQSTSCGLCQVNVPCENGVPVK